MSETGHSSKEVTISKSTYKFLIIGFVAVLMASSFTTGFILGGTGGTAKTGDSNLQDAGNNQPAPNPSGGGNTPPETVSVSLDDDATKGNPGATVQLIEFSDFQCPFCGRFYDQTLGQIETNYVDTGKVLFAYRDFPLESIHQEARPAALASECAKEQGKFWEYHNKLFENQESLGTASYKQWAGELGLNTAQFNSCLDSAKYGSEIDKDFQDGVNAGVSGTPTFFVCKNGSCERIVGAQPYSTIKGFLDAALA